MAVMLDIVGFYLLGLLHDYIRDYIHAYNLLHDYNVDLMENFEFLY